MSITEAPKPSPCYSERLDRALALAADAFRYTRRKGTSIPYLTHLLQVAVTVGEQGGDEDQMIAALLHDYLEDIDGASPEDIAESFGPEVAEMVGALSDHVGSGVKRPWELRKVAYLGRLAGEPPRVKLVSAADKLHNARSIRRDLRLVGAQVWDRFSSSPSQNVWYYSELVRALGEGWSHPLLNELEGEVEALCREIERSEATPAREG
jgi:(p)ppGpp synthase/HD superfamily hydrolase